MRKTTTFTTTEPATGPLSDPHPDSPSTALNAGPCTKPDYKNYPHGHHARCRQAPHPDIRRCPNPDCSRYHRPFRPEAESLLALPYHEFGLDVLALVGRLRPRRASQRPRDPPRVTAVALPSPALGQQPPGPLRRTGALATADPRRLHALSASSVASCWPSTACSPTSATKSCGSCAIVFPARSCWRAACSRPRSRTWRRC